MRDRLEAPIMTMGLIMLISPSYIFLTVLRGGSSSSHVHLFCNSSSKAKETLLKESNTIVAWTVRPLLVADTDESMVRFLSPSGGEWDFLLVGGCMGALGDGLDSSLGVSGRITAFVPAVMLFKTACA